MYGPVRTVVWEGRGREASPYPDFDGTEFAGPARERVTSAEAAFMFIGAEGPGGSTTNFSARLRTRQVATDDGEHQFSLISTGPSRLYVDGELVVDNSDFAYGEEYFATASDEISGFLHLERGRAYDILVEWRSPEQRQSLTLTALRIGLSPMVGFEAIERAVAVADGADAALLFVGLNGEWDAEGKDRPNLDLPGAQDELIRRVAATNPNTIVVL